MNAVGTHLTRILTFCKVTHVHLSFCKVTLIHLSFCKKHFQLTPEINLNGLKSDMKYLKNKVNIYQA